MPKELSESACPARRLIVCADDLGLNHDINVAILELARLGRLSAASAMSEGEIVAPIVAELKDLPVALGLHLNFTQILPREAPGVWRGSLGKLIALSHLHCISLSQIEHTIETQFDRFESVFGQPPAYIDGHQHVHQFPIIRKALIAALNRRYAGRKIWLRNTVRPRAGKMPFAFKAAIIEFLGARELFHEASRSGWACSKNLLGVYDFQGSLENYLSLLERWLSLAGDGDVLFFHPATQACIDDELGAQRWIEYQAFLHPAFGEALARHRIVLR